MANPIANKPVVVSVDSKNSKYILPVQIQFDSTNTGGIGNTGFAIVDPKQYQKNLILPPIKFVKGTVIFSAGAGATNSTLVIKCKDTGDIIEFVSHSTNEDITSFALPLIGLQNSSYEIDITSSAALGIIVANLMFMTWDIAPYIEKFY